MVWLEGAEQEARVDTEFNFASPVLRPFYGIGNHLPL
jgi:hypothetical protein